MLCAQAPSKVSPSPSQRAMDSGRCQWGNAKLAYGHSRERFVRLVRVPKESWIAVVETARSQLVWESSLLLVLLSRSTNGWPAVSWARTSGGRESGKSTTALLFQRGSARRSRFSHGVRMYLTPPVRLSRARRSARPTLPSWAFRESVGNL